MKVLKEAIREAIHDLDDLELVKRTDGAIAKKHFDMDEFDSDLDKQIIEKVGEIADALAVAFDKEGISLDPQLIADDMLRDCGLMGETIADDDFDMNNPFDVATKQMHDIGPVNKEEACRMLLAADPQEFASTFIRGLKASRGLLPPGMDRRHAMIGHTPKMIEELKEEVLDEKVLFVEDYLMKLLNEDIKGYFKNQYENKFKQKNLSEKDFMKLIELDPTYKKDGQQRGSYTDWLARLVVKGVPFEDIMANAHEYTDQLAAFTDLKKRNRLPGDKKDIMQFKTLEDLMNMLMSLGGSSSEDGATSHSDFKQDISDIRKGITKITGLPDENIPSNIQKVEDVFEFLGENEKWEIWGAKNEFATMIFDRWGNGAGWCVGGMLGNNRGVEQLRQAQNYYPHYNANGTATYVCFQQKDKNAPRPTNKYLITLGENGSLPNNGGSGYQFNDSNNRTQYLGEHSWGDDSQLSQMDAFAEFLHKEGLSEVFKKTRFKDCEAFLNIENKERLEKGEPYKYVGGKIRSSFKTSIQTLVFTEEGKEHTITDVQGKNKDFLSCESTNEMLNMLNLKNGEPFIYNGEKIKDIFKELIVTVKFSNDYDVKIPKVIHNEQIEVVGIPNHAFVGCVNLKDVYLAKNIVAFGWGAFKGCEKAIIHSWNTKLSCNPPDADYLRQHIKIERE